MAVNPNRSGTRLLAVFEHIAQFQPLGVRELARSMGLDKSAVQRAIATLAEAKWIQPSPNRPGTWELTMRIVQIAHFAQGGNSLRDRVRPVLEQIRDITGETAFLALPELDGLVVVETAESKHPLRIVIPVGVTLGSDSEDPYQRLLTPLHQVAMGDASLHQDGHTASSLTGHTLCHENGDDDSLTIAASIYGSDQNVIGVIAICAVRMRITEKHKSSMTRMISQKARELSCSQRSGLSSESIKKAIGGFG